MTQELREIFDGTRVPEVRIVDYTTPEGKEKLKAVINQQQAMRRRREVDWQRFNSFVVTI